MPSRTVSAAAIAAVLLLAGCKGEGPAGPPARSPDRYTLRGEIVRLPAPGASPAELSIRHEAIPDFKNAGGEVVGMHAMVMPFAVGPGVSLDGLAPGDKIRFRFAMDWARNTLELESLEELPPDTALEFERAR